MKKILLPFLLLWSYQQIFAQQTVGVFSIDSSAIYEGYTLFCPSSSTDSYLINNCGEEIKKWTSDYKPGNALYLLENGNLLRTAKTPSFFTGGGYGGGVEIKDWDDNLLWQFVYSDTLRLLHHDVEYLPNGNILMMAWIRRSYAECIAAGRDTSIIGPAGIWSEQVIEVEPVGTDSGTIVWEWDCWDHLIQDFDSTKNSFGVISDHPELVDINFSRNAAGATSEGIDLWHFNSIDYNPALDQIMLGCHANSEIWVIDHSTTTAEAAGHTGGNSGKGGDLLYRWGNPAAYDRGDSTDRVLFKQHDPHWILPGKPNEGKVMIFNNGRDRPAGQFSTIEIIEPPADVNGNYTLNAGQAYGPTSVFYNYTANPPQSFYASFISGADQLQNGNILICEGPKGHFFEVTPAGDIVWDYISPIGSSGPVSQGDVLTPSVIFRAYKYGTDYAAFDGRTLYNQGAIELNPISYICQYGVPIGVTEVEENTAFTFNNPFSDVLRIDNEEGLELQVELIDIMGRVVRSLKSSDSSIWVDTNDLHRGLYLVNLRDQNNQIYSYKGLKQ